MTRESCLSILSGWITIAQRRNLPGKVAEFWLLRDYADGTIWSAAFYRAHVEKALKIIHSLDTTKEEAKKVFDYLNPIIVERGK